jgi:homoprotocatechuate degradation regulator HpaR
MKRKSVGSRSKARQNVSISTEPNAEQPWNGDKAPIRPFANSLPMQLLRVREAVMERFRPHLHAHAMTEQQWRIVRALAEADSLEIHEVGNRCCIHPASLSHMLPKLEAAGLITRKANTLDQRRIVVSLAPAGRRIFLRMGVESEKIYAAISRQLGPKRIEVLYQQLAEALQILSEQDGEAQTTPPTKKRTRKRKHR